MKFEEKLLKLRKEKQLSQEQVANELLVSRQSISKWESGTSMPDIDNLIKLSEVFQVSLDYLLKDDYMREIREKQNEDVGIVVKMSFAGGALGLAASFLTMNFTLSLVGILVGFATGALLDSLKIVK